MTQVFKLERNFMEFSVDLEGVKCDFRFYAKNDPQEQKSLELAKNADTPLGMMAFIEHQYTIIAQNLVCTSHKEAGKEAEFLENLKANGKTAEFLNFTDEALKSAFSQKKSTLEALVKEQALLLSGAKLLAPTHSNDPEILEILQGFNLATRLDIEGFSGLVHVWLDYLVLKDWAAEHGFDKWFLLELYKGFAGLTEGVLHENVGP
ncbi:hypothetical protein NHP190003_13420 [Helicobacter sp. NHP19-003]|uniref:Uncharacterized protein n=1 Tax=Helicobacter gastrocanis TaxID=2849641 RepID=A0ABN6I3C0_9HELI|nr:hypothetical protein [Helicobacter sp. NHP19-003]BCZ18060.1 hypothetical protein NHP190003_13420 [Helicobacter sp. NHP19-003]